MAVGLREESQAALASLYLVFLTAPDTEMDTQVGPGHPLHAWRAAFGLPPPF